MCAKGLADCGYPPVAGRGLRLGTLAQRRPSPPVRVFVVKFPPIQTRDTKMLPFLLISLSTNLNRAPQQACPKSSLSCRGKWRPNKSYRKMSCQSQCLSRPLSFNVIHKPFIRANQKIENGDDLANQYVSPPLWGWPKRNPNRHPCGLRARHTARGGWLDNLRRARCRKTLFKLPAEHL